MLEWLLVWVIWQCSKLLHALLLMLHTCCTLLVVSCSLCMLPLLKIGLCHLIRELELDWGIILNLCHHKRAAV
ncbi:hypothetical protein BC830DRAFT_1159505, partial [Chytriomyces sp. MP71]